MTTPSRVDQARVHIRVTGRVQGVGFRAFVLQSGPLFGLTGWVRNMADGRVEAVFVGDDADIDKMLAWCHIGPSAARVDEVLTEEEPPTGEFRDFSIKY